MFVEKIMADIVLEEICKDVWAKNKSVVFTEDKLNEIVEHVFWRAIAYNSLISKVMVPEQMIKEELKEMKNRVLQGFG